MTIQAWTFLISRNQSIDYKTIVAPDFISEAKIRSLLLKVSDDNFPESQNISIREVHGSEVGNFTVVFRSVKARSQDIEQNENTVLKDPFGREIYWVEGLVFRKSQTELLNIIGEIHLDQAHRELQEKYREFWHEDRLSISHEIDLVETTSAPNNKFIQLEPFVITPKPDFIEHQTRKTQRDKTYALNKPVRRKVDWSRFVFIAITALLLIGIFGLWNRSQSADICLYGTQTTTISFNPDRNSSAKSDGELLGIQGLQTLRDKNKKAWISLTGNLTLESSLINDIQNTVKNQKIEEKEKKTLEIKNKDQLTMTAHPIDAVIVLLQKKKVISGQLAAIIIKPSSSSSNRSNCDLAEYNVDRAGIGTFPKLK